MDAFRKKLSACRWANFRLKLRQDNFRSSLENQHSAQCFRFVDASTWPVERWHDHLCWRMPKMWLLAEETTRQPCGSHGRIFDLSSGKPTSEANDRGVRSTWPKKGPGSLANHTAAGRKFFAKRSRGVRSMCRGVLGTWPKKRPGSLADHTAAGRTFFAKCSRGVLGT